MNILPSLVPTSKSRMPSCAAAVCMLLANCQQSGGQEAQKNTTHWEVSESEVRAAMKIIQHDTPTYPLAEKSPVMQSALNDICGELSNRIITGTLSTSLIDVRREFIISATRNFGEISESSVQIRVLPPTRNLDGYEFCEISFFIAGRTYTSKLSVPNKLYRNPAGFITGGTLAQGIAENMKEEFLTHIHRKIITVLYTETIDNDSLPRILEKVKPFLLEESEGFQALGNELSGEFSVLPIGDDYRLYFVIGTKPGGHIKLGIPLGTQK